MATNWTAPQTLKISGRTARSTGDCFFLQVTAQDSQGWEFATRNDALCALIDRTAAGDLEWGLHGAAVFEYRLDDSAQSKTQTLAKARSRKSVVLNVDSVDSFAAQLLPINKRLRRRWFLRSVGDSVPAYLAFSERTEHLAPETRKSLPRYVLHVYDIASGRLGPVAVHNQHYCRDTTHWLARYTLAHHLYNMPIVQLRKEARKSNQLSFFARLMVGGNRSLLVALAYRHAFRQRSSDDEEIDFDACFAFETLGIHRHVFEAPDYVRV